MDNVHQLEDRSPAGRIDISVIVPISERHDPVADVFEEYHRALEASERSFEFIYVLDGLFPEALAELRLLKATYENLTIVVLPRYYGEATAIKAGFDYAAGEKILTLPAYRQVESTALQRLFDYQGQAQFVLAKRCPRTDGLFNRLQARVFNLFSSSLSGLELEDGGCNVRMFSRQVLEEVDIYGDLHRFLPHFADRQGFKIEEIDLEQSVEANNTRIYPIGLYLRRALDLLTVFFLVRFTKKPFRFFGLIGSAIGFAGLLVTAWVGVERVFLDVALSGRPSMLLGSLLMAFGLQIFSVGLIAELLIFTHARELREYTVHEVVE